MAFTRAVVTCNIIVRSRGRLNWISNLIKHPTLLVYSGTSQAIRVWRVKYGQRGAGRFSRKLIRVLVIISHDPMSVVTRHTSHNQRSSSYPGSQKIRDRTGGHRDMRDRHLVCDVYLEMILMTNSELLGWETQWPVSSLAGGAGLTMDVFNKQEPIVQRLRADILGQLNPFIQPGPVHISWYFTRLEN